jgi:DNA-binding MarR family transcriptional regulator
LLHETKLLYCVNVSIQESTDLFIALGAVVKRLHRRALTPQQQETLQGVPFAPRHIAALLQIGPDEPTGVSELAHRLDVSLATMSQVVSDLESWGLVERASDTADRRRTLVSVAAEHRDNIRAIQEQRLRPLSRALRRLEPDERAALVRGLEVLAEELGADDPALTTPHREKSR